MRFTRNSSLPLIPIFIFFLLFLCSGCGSSEPRENNAATESGSAQSVFADIFHDVTIELGEGLPDISEFLEEGASAESSRFEEGAKTLSFERVGTYEVPVRYDTTVGTVLLHVVDTTPPTLTLREITVTVSAEVSESDFIESVSDLSGSVTTKVLSEWDTSEPKTFSVIVQAEDESGNVTVEATTLTVISDTVPPVIAGLSDLLIPQGADPDYLEGVSAFDTVDGYVDVRCSSEAVDVNTAGTYYIVYTASDANGNTATARRRVIVMHYAEDTASLVASVAESLSATDPESLRDYVRNTLAYNTDWGGDDAVWYGFTTHSGNCYVHAVCLQALLDYFGYTNHLIWLPDESHYWNLVLLDIGWRHIDSTPIDRHMTYSLMTDEQRQETFLYEDDDWDHSLWPAATE